MEYRVIRNVMVLSVLSGTLFVGCASKPTINQQSSRVFYVPEFYTVKSGDSLSKIAQKYGLDYREIARINNIETMDIIYVNQSLRLRGNSKNTSRLVQTRPIQEQGTIQRESVLTQAQNATVPNQVNVVQPNIPTTAPAVGLGNTPAPTINPNPVATSTQGLNWVMPSNGRVIDRYDLSQNKKGVRFAGNSGDPIYAAAAGEVVYADDGLKEYGQLVLLRHSNGYITAYAHNSKLVVKNGDKVTAGQKIAEMGSTGTNKTMLEFQVRLDGKPIDPVSILPIS
ncbi:peptidoglycan DD-metalloendopeptidase family protein [Acinetobacter sp. A3.8]|uniref:Peptidoglycan DD-metalloendopeptidase family protein n=1 Tax=Acinetobacter sedimenti TaxID=2919922 RepID=A0A9X2B6E0_9GAMM|nr:peptidoglycan DD-metalloendopeptidase family protein [Acinetobacter sedimenti]MCJ8146781.1 peptidoglycan DD-metalloendopeptidase family protein [Acinetobacter sedimenti]